MDFGMVWSGPSLPSHLRLPSSANNVFVGCNSLPFSRVSNPAAPQFRRLQLQFASSCRGETSDGAGSQDTLGQTFFRAHTLRVVLQFSRCRASLTRLSRF